MNLPCRPLAFLALSVLLLGAFIPLQAEPPVPLRPALAEAVARYGGPRADLKVGDRVLLESSAGPLDVAVTQGEIKAVRPDGELVVLETFTWYADGRDQSLRRRVPLAVEPGRFTASIQERMARRAATFEGIAARTRQWLPAATTSAEGTPRQP